MFRRLPHTSFSSSGRRRLTLALLMLLPFPVSIPLALWLTRQELPNRPFFAIR